MKSVRSTPEKKQMAHPIVAAIVVGGLVLFTAHVVILFGVIPSLSDTLSPFYGQDLYSDGYNQIAANLAHGNGYRFYPETAKTLMREPGYPILLAGIFLVFGQNLVAVKAVNLCFAFATAVLMIAIARRLSGNIWMILIPPVLFLCHPATLIAESRGAVEIPFAFLVVAFMLVLYRAMQSNRWAAYLGSGLVLGLTVLVRSTPLLFPVFLFAYLLLAEAKILPRLTTVRNMAVMVAAMVAVLSPWIIRNYFLTKQFVPTASVLGVSAQAGQYICLHAIDGTPWILRDREAAEQRKALADKLGYAFKRDDPYYQVFYSSADELRFSRYLMRGVVSVYRESPALCLKCMAQNLFNFWCAGRTPQSTIMNFAVQLPYLLLAALGGFLGVKGGKGAIIGPMVLIVCYFMAVHDPILAQARYSVPLLPFISILATRGLLETLRKPADLRVGEELSRQTQSSGLAHCSAEKRLKPLSAAHLSATKGEIWLSIVIPAYNEEARLPRTLTETVRWCTTQDFDFEIVVVDDGSIDGTLRLAREFEGGDPHVRTLACPHRGKGAAVRAGILHSKGQLMLFMDADGATPLGEIPKLLTAIQAGNDVAIGSRAVQHTSPARVKTSLHRRFIGRVFSRVVNLFGVRGIADTQCGFKMFRREAALSVFSVQRIWGFAFDVEILFIARRMALSIAEIPVNWVAQSGSKVNLFTDSIKMLRDIAVIRWLHRNSRSEWRRPEISTAD